MKYLLSCFFLFLCCFSCESKPTSIFDFETTDEIVEFLLEGACEEPLPHKEGYTHFTRKGIVLFLYPSCHNCYMSCYKKYNSIDVTKIETTDSLRKFLQMAYDNNGVDSRYPYSQKKTTIILNEFLSPSELKQKTYQVLDAIEKININRPNPITQQWLLLDCEYSDKL